VGEGNRAGKHASARRHDCLRARACAHALVLQLPVRVVGEAVRWMKVVGKAAGG